MSQPNFNMMSRQDLHAYVLAHRGDQEAFYVYVDKLHAEASWVEMPPLQSAEELEQYPEFLEHVHNNAESHDPAL